MAEPKRRRRAVFWIFFAILSLLTAAELIALRSQKIADFYVSRIAPRLSNAVGGLVQHIPVPVSEICLALLAVFVPVLVILLILLIFLRKREKYRKAVGFCVRFALVLTVLSVGWHFRYDFAGMSSTPIRQPQTHDFDDLDALFTYTIEQINTLSVQAERDENYHLIRRSDAEIQAAIDNARNKLSADYPRFALAEPPVPKESLFSAVVTNYGTGAYYIEPFHENVFTVRTQNRSTYPSVYAHEYSHYSGFYKEDEANFFGLLLCLESDDVNLQYTAWLNVMNDVWDEIEKEYFGDAPVDYDDPDFIDYCNSTPEYDVWLVVGDASGNYKKFHEERGEENVVDERKPEPKLPEGAAELISKQGQKHYTNLRKQLGPHYYDGVVQLMLDYFADELHA